jgi:hypothetical protein
MDSASGSPFAGSAILLIGIENTPVLFVCQEEIPKNSGFPFPEPNILGPKGRKQINCLKRVTPWNLLPSISLCTP